MLESEQMANHYSAIRKFAGIDGSTAVFKVPTCTAALAALVTVAIERGLARRTAAAFGPEAPVSSVAAAEKLAIFPLASVQAQILFLSLFSSRYAPAESHLDLWLQLSIAFLVTIVEIDQSSYEGNLSF